MAKLRVRRIVLVVAFAVVVAGCTPRFDTWFLSRDELGGRPNATTFSANARQYLIGQMKSFSSGLNSTLSGDASYTQPFTDGVNVVGVIRGDEFPGEYVIVGAHYDHVGSSCERGIDPADTICNGATDNATGVAAALEIGRQIQRTGPPRRSVIIALWDREEDGLLGSRHYVQNPLVPLAQTVAYVNFDIIGANILPSLRNDTFAIGAETGGSVLSSLLDGAIEHSPLDARPLSLTFGQGRSDHATFASAQVPTVFFSDATGPCYHHVDDEYEIVDFAKLDAQIALATELTRGLVEQDMRPTFVANTPAATYGDTVQLQGLIERVVGSDLSRFTPTQQQTILNSKATVDAIVADGPANFDSTDALNLLSGAAATVNILTTGVCDGFLDAA
jgi:hypothetical protein